jgi:adenosylcobinamide-GDP ribazoletransferase
MKRQFMKRRFTLFLVAIQFLTRLPVPPLDGFQPDWLARSARYFPLVGVLVGLISIGVWWLASLVFPPIVAVGSMIAASLLLTGAFHEDGFADVCDGFGGGRTRDAVLSIMKDSRIGAYGAIGIGMMLALKWVTLISLPRSALSLTVVSAHMISRWCAIGLIWWLPYVRADADAKSKPLAGSLGAGDWLMSGLLGTVGLLPMIWLGDPATGGPRLLVLLSAVAPALACVALAGAYFKARLGGYTGDCLGAAQQLSELVFMLATLGCLTAFQ